MWCLVFLASLSSSNYPPVAWCPEVTPFTRLACHCIESMTRLLTCADWSISSARSRWCALRRTSSSSSLFTSAVWVPWFVSLRMTCLSTPRCWQPTSACLFFACRRWCHEVSLSLVCLILSRGLTISVFVTLQLPGDLRMTLYAFFAHSHW